MSAHPEDYEAAYQAGYLAGRDKERANLAAWLSEHGQQMLVGLIIALTTPTPKPAPTCFCGQPNDRERVHRAHACEPWRTTQKPDEGLE
jgi:hypothetical protein